MRIHFSLSLSRNFYLLSKHGLFFVFGTNSEWRNGNTRCSPLPRTSIHPSTETTRWRMNGDGVTSPFSHTHYENVARSNAPTIEARNDLSRHRDISHLTCKIDSTAMCLVSYDVSLFFFPRKCKSFGGSRERKRRRVAE